eukprot:12387816-Karenia_brevis.AAC.1
MMMMMMNAFAHHSTNEAPCTFGGAPSTKAGKKIAYGKVVFVKAYGCHAKLFRLRPALKPVKDDTHKSRYPKNPKNHSHVLVRRMHA